MIVVVCTQVVYVDRVRTNSKVITTYDGCEAAWKQWLIHVQIRLMTHEAWSERGRGADIVNGMTTLLLVAIRCCTVSVGVKCEWRMHVYTLVSELRARDWIFYLSLSILSLFLSSSHFDLISFQQQNGSRCDKLSNPEGFLTIIVTPKKVLWGFPSNLVSRNLSFNSLCVRKWLM